MLLRFFQTIGQVRGREESHTPSLPAGRQTQGNGQMRLARPRMTDQADIAVFVDPTAAGQLHNLRLVQGRLGREVVVVEVLGRREVGLLDEGLEPVGRPRRHLHFGQAEQVLRVALVGCRRLAGQRLEFGIPRRQVELFAIALEQQGVGFGHVVRCSSTFRCRPCFGEPAVPGARPISRGA